MLEGSHQWIATCGFTPRFTGLARPEQIATFGSLHSQWAQDDEKTVPWNACNGDDAAAAAAADDDDDDDDDDDEDDDDEDEDEDDDEIEWFLKNGVKGVMI